MASPSRSVLTPLRQRVRRVQLVVGVGFFAFVVGSILSAQLALALGPVAAGLDSSAARLLLFIAVSRFWVYALLPLFGYGLGRVFDARPTATAVGSALTGELFALAVQYVTLGLAGLHRSWAETSLRLATLAGGVALTRWALLRARTAAARAQAAAEVKAAANRSAYAEFAAEAERLAERREQLPISPTAAPPVSSADAPAEERSSETAEGSPGPGREGADGPSS